MSIILAHSGKQHSYQVAKALYNLNELERFYTSSYITSSALQSYLLKKGNTFWTKRFIEGLPGKYVQSNWRFELPELLLRFQQGKSAKVQRAVYDRDINFDKYMANELTKLSKQNKKLTYWGFQGSCYESLKQANKLGVESWCELATAHVTSAKKILGEEAALHPEWASTIDNLTFPSDYEKRLEEEPNIAKRVFAASAFTKQTLLDVGISESKITLLPLGCDLNHIVYEKREENLESRPLKLLYAGTVTQRKGIKYLLEAIKTLKSKVEYRDSIELHIIGGVQGNSTALNQYKGLFTYHAPLSQTELFNAYKEYDALILPTIFEGFGLVIVEAMAAGLPVITTSHSIGPDVITEGVNGSIIPIRDVQAIVDAIISLRSKSNKEMSLMRDAAVASAKEYSWNSYQERLKIILEQMQNS